MAYFSHVVTSLITNNGHWQTHAHRLLKCFAFCNINPLFERSLRERQWETGAPLSLHKTHTVPSHRVVGLAPVTALPRNSSLGQSKGRAVAPSPQLVFHPNISQ